MPIFGFNEMTGDKKYLRAAVRCAEAAGEELRVGDGAYLAVAFRCFAKDGSIKGPECFAISECLGSINCWID